MKYVLLMTLVLSAIGQEAKVIPLSNVDASRARAVYDAMKKAEADWQGLQAEIQHQYISDAREEPDYGTSGTLNVLSGDASSSNSILRMDGSVRLIGQAEMDPCHAYQGPTDIDLEGTPLCIAYRKVQAEREAKRQAERDEASRREQERIARLPKKTVYTPKPGWEHGFQFSDGFQFIVPKAEPLTPKNTWPGLLGSGAVTIPADCYHSNGCFTVAN